MEAELPTIIYAYEFELALLTLPPNYICAEVYESWGFTVDESDNIC